MFQCCTYCDTNVVRSVAFPSKISQTFAIYPLDLFNYRAIGFDYADKTLVVLTDCGHEACNMSWIDTRLELILEHLALIEVFEKKIR